MGNMYLVLVRTNLDEIPILLTGSHQRAYGKAYSVKQGEIDEAFDLMGVDGAGLISTAVIRFQDGKPKYIRNVKDLSGQEMADAATI